ncbi:hypothetical protein [Escherichia marmotae]|uniref:hypothetical protein n=1 Tax=Escherichia marmotae TaxID=1499973 RepID=UPI002815C0A2|nr:hypothetical protein [Escherichia marmotae]
MNKKLLAVVLAASCFSAGNAMAVDGGEININGLVSDETCPATVNGGSNDVNITLKTAKPSDITALNDKALGAYPAAISISVNCSNAAANKTATMSFTSTFHSSTQGLWKTTTPSAARLKVSTSHFTMSPPPPRHWLK